MGLVSVLYRAREIFAWFYVWPHVGPPLLLEHVCDLVCSEPVLPFEDDDGVVVGVACFRAAFLPDASGVDSSFCLTLVVEAVSDSDQVLGEHVCACLDVVACDEDTGELVVARGDCLLVHSDF